jgi:hypothetical protein
MFLFCAELASKRDHAYDIDQVSDDGLQQLAEMERKRAKVHNDKADGPIIQQTPSVTPIPRKKTFVESMAVTAGVHSHDNIIKQLIGPFVTLLNLGAGWSVVVSGLLSMWYVTTAIVAAALFSGPPWNFGPSQVGYLSSGPFLGGVVAIIIILLSDPVAKWLTKLNKGI